MPSTESLISCNCQYKCLEQSEYAANKNRISMTKNVQIDIEYLGIQIFFYMCSEIQSETSRCHIFLMEM